MFAILLMLAIHQAGAVEWQWSVEVKGGRERGGKPRAFLWIPPGCERVRGLIVAQNNMEEQMILENPRFRRAMADLEFAEIWVDQEHFNAQSPWGLAEQNGPAVRVPHLVLTPASPIRKGQS